MYCAFVINNFLLLKLLRFYLPCNQLWVITSQEQVLLFAYFMYM